MNADETALRITLAFDVDAQDLQEASGQIRSRLESDLGGYSRRLKEESARSLSEALSKVSSDFSRQADGALEAPLGKLRSMYEEIGRGFDAIFDSPAADAFFHEVRRFFTQDPEWLKAARSGDGAAMGRAAATGAAGAIGGALGEQWQRSDLMGELTGALPLVGSLLGEIPLGGLIGAGLGAAVGRLLGKKEPVPVVVQNAAEIAARLGEDASIAAGDPLARAFGRADAVTPAFAYEQSMDAQREALRRLYDAQARLQRERYERYADFDPRTAGAALAEYERLIGERDRIDERLQGIYRREIDGLVAYYDALGRATGAAGADLAAHIETVVQGLEASRRIAGRDLTPEDGEAYRKALEQSKAAAGAFQELQRTLADLEGRAQALSEALADFGLGVDRAVASLSGRAIAFLSDRVRQLGAALSDPERTGEGLVQAGGEFQQALEARRVQAVGGLERFGAGVSEAIRRQFEGWAGVIDGAYVEVEGSLPRAQRLFAEFMDAFDEWIGGIARADAQLSDLAAMRDRSARRIEEMRFSIVHGLEELTPGEQLPFLRRRLDERAAAGADFEERRGLIEDFQESVFTAYNRTEIGRPEALRQLEAIGGLFEGLYAEREASLRAERERLVGLVDGSDWLSRRGVSFEDFASAEELARAVQLAHAEEISGLRAEEAERIWAAQEFTRQAVEQLNRQTAMSLELVRGSIEQRIGDQLEQMRGTQLLLQAILDALRERGENLLVRLAVDGQSVGEVIARLSESGTIYVDDRKIKVN